MKDDRLISLNAAIDAMMKLQTEDIEAYGASIPEGFDGDRAVTALKALPSAQPVNIAKLQPNCNQVASDCISRQAALDALTEWYDNDDDKRSAKDVIRELPQEQQWSCGKPKHNGRYIVTYWSRLHDDEQCRVQIMRFQNGHWVYPRHIPEWINGEIEEKVLAWCELPTPYREGGQDEQ